jgi:hypothetical protein
MVSYDGFWRPLEIVIVKIGLWAYVPIHQTEAFKLVLGL